MFTAALFNKDIAPCAAVYVQDTKSWKLVKNFNEEPVCEKRSDIGLSVASSIPSLDVSPTELFSMLRSIEEGIALYCDEAVRTNPQAEAYRSAVPDAVKSMFQGFRTSTPYGGTQAHTVCITHGRNRFVYNPESKTWEFEGNSFEVDGEFREVNGSGKHYHFSCQEFVDFITAYLNTFPIASTGNVGVVYTMSMC